MADRLRGIQVHRPIIYGSHARFLTDEELETAPPGHTHKWTVFLTSAASPPPKEGESEDMNYLPGGADDLSYMIKRVTFKLHDTYTPSSRQCDKPPYKVTETGWGEFGINIRVQFVPEASEKPLNFVHSLKLHHLVAPTQAPPPTGPPPTDSPAPQPTIASTVVTPAPPATTGPNTPVPDEIVLSEKKTEDKTEKNEASQEKEASQAPTETVETDKMDVDGSGEVTAEIKTETAASTPLPTDTMVANQSATQIDIGDSITATHPLLVVSTQPVHSWQYDELVFSDPPSAFFDILNEHPATPLPAKLRRPRDQREIDEGPKKKSKGRASTSDVVSRAQTQEPVGTPAPVPASTRPPVGSVGESASADVPLEFAKEMEIGEHNRLTDLKITIIEQMDKLRTRLIAQEKELNKLKAEMKVG